MCTICYMATYDAWMWQPFGPTDNTLDFAFPGTQDRTYPALRVCNACKNALQRHPTLDYMFTHKGRRYWLVDGIVYPQNELPASIKFRRRS